MVAKRRKSKSEEVQAPPESNRSQRQGGNQAAVAMTSGSSPIGTMTTPEKLAWWALLGLVFFVPIATSNWTWLGFQVPFTFDQFDIIKVFVMRAFLVVGLAAWAWHILFNGGKIRFTWVFYLVVAFVIWTLLTTITSIHPETALFGKYRRFEGLMSFITYAGVLFLGIQLLDRMSRIKKMAQTFFWSAVIVNGYGIMQSLGVDPNLWGALPFEAYRAFSTFGNPNFLGGFTIFALGVSLGLVLSEQRPTWRAVWWVGFLMSVWCWVVAFTRGAWVGGAIAIAIIIAFALWQRAKFSGTDGIFAGGIGLLVATLTAISLNSPHPVMNVGERLSTIFVFDQGSGGTRLQIWQAAIAAIQERPIFGYGADTFRLIFPRFKPFEYTEAAGYLSVADNAHNYPLQLMTTLGIPGFLLLYAVFVVVAFLSARHLLRSTHSGGDKFLMAGLWAACFGFIVSLNFGLAITGKAVFTWVFMAALMAPLARTITVKPVSWAPVGAFSAAALAAVMFYFNFTHVLADNYHLRASVMTQGVQRVEAAEGAVRLNPFNDMYRAELAMAHMDLFSGHLAGLQAARGTPEEESRRAAAIQQFEVTERVLLDVIEFVPWEFDNYVFLSNLYVGAGQFLDRAYYQRAVDIARRGIYDMGFENGPALRLQLANALLELGDAEGAYREISLAASQDRNFADAHFVLAIAAERVGDLDRAHQALSHVLLIRPDYPGAAQSLANLEARMAETPTVQP